MQTAITTSPTVEPVQAGLAVGARARRRALLLLLTVTALAPAAILGAGEAGADPELVRLLRFMALLKGVFAVIALGTCWWRLARPAAAWRETVYVAGPGLMAGGAACLWQLQSAGLATIGLHLGMFALLAAALTDSAFIPALRPHAVRGAAWWARGARGPHR